MPLELLIAGAALGFAVAVPVGPIGLICIQRTLGTNRVSGYAAGLGAATADGIYSLIAGYGLSLVADVFLFYRGWLGITGGLFLCAYGLRTFWSRPRLQPVPVRFLGLLGAFLSTFLLTLANPLNILLFAAVFTSVGLASHITNLSAHLLLTVGVFLGALAWWLALTTLVSFFRSRFSERALVWANRISGLLILLAGVLAFVSLLGLRPLHR